MMKNKELLSSLLLKRNMQSPFEINNARNQTLAEIMELRSDRETEFNTCVEALLTSRANIFLYGERGVGKTFLVRLIEEELKEYSNNVFTFTLNASEILWYDRYDPVAAFPAAVLIHLCDAIWRKLYGRDPEDLVAPLFDPKHCVKTKNLQQDLIQKINTRIRLQQRKFISQRKNTVGLSAIAKAELDETYIEERTPIALLPFEFFQFIESIQRKIFQPIGTGRIIVLCDEVNILSMIRQKELIERYVEMFTDRSLQFLFVAGFIPGLKKLDIPDGFDVNLELTAFRNAKEIRDLIDGRLKNCDYEMCQEAYEELLTSVGGNPRIVLMTCEIARRIAIKRSEKMISFRDIKTAAHKIKIEITKQKEIIMKQTQGYPVSPVPEVS